MIVVVNLRTKEINTVKSIKQFGYQIGLTDLDHSDNWFYQNLNNMTQNEYVLSEDKKSLTFEYNSFLIKRV